MGNDNRNPIGSPIVGMHRCQRVIWGNGGGSAVKGNHDVDQGMFYRARDDRHDDQGMFCSASRQHVEMALFSSCIEVAICKIYLISNEIQVIFIHSFK